MLVGGGAEVDKSDPDDGQTALILAAEAGRTEVIAALLAAGAAVDKVNNQGITPLLMAAQEGLAEIVATLLAAGAEVDKTDSNEITPLWWAAQNGHMTTAQALLSAGADKSVKMQWGTPLEIARWQGHAEVVALLL